MHSAASVTHKAVWCCAFRYTPPFYNFSSSALRAWWVEHLLSLARLNATVDPSGTTPLYVKRMKSVADEWVGGVPRCIVLR